MYNSKLVVSLKTKDGKIIREHGEIVNLPFGMEYSLMIKNLEARKAKVKIEIDGTDVLDGNSILVNPNQTLELEGFMKGNKAVNSFKFIEKTEEISEFRGDRIDDGIIKVEFVFEKMKPITQPITYTNYPSYTWYSGAYGLRGMDIGSSGSSGGCGGNVTKSLSATAGDWVAMENSCTVSASCCSVDSYGSTDGITVKGQEVLQDFKYGYIGELEEQSHVICLKLQGYKDNNEKVEQIITVKDKLQCKTCGKFCKSNAKFCDRCGTYLE